MTGPKQKFLGFVVCYQDTPGYLSLPKYLRVESWQHKAATVTNDFYDATVFSTQEEATSWQELFQAAPDGDHLPAKLMGVAQELRLVEYVI